MPSFTVLNAISTVLAFTLLSITIAASITSWYKYSETFNLQTPSSTNVGVGSSASISLNYTVLTFDLQQKNTLVNSGNIDTRTATAYNGNTNVFSIIKLVQAFALTALLVSAILTIYFFLVFYASFRAKVVYQFGATVTRRIVMFTALLLVVAVIIAFLALMGITGALQRDSASCTTGPCDKFSDSYSISQGTHVKDSITYNLSQDFAWGPDAGWFLFLACIPLSVSLVIVAGLNNYPIPIDSVGSGEAL
jgi:hypothetical protein